MRFVRLKYDEAMMSRLTHSKLWATQRFCDKLESTQNRPPNPVTHPTRSPTACGGFPAIIYFTMPKLRHLDNEGTARFVTFNCYRNLPALDNTRAKEILVEHLKQARNKHQFKILGYVIMPNHAHLVLHPPEGMKLGLVIGEIKSRSARQWFSETNVPATAGSRVFWERRCYDHNCRTNASVVEKINYCHANPVRQGLVKEMGDWSWSSYNWYQGKRAVPLEIDSVEL